MEVGCGAGAFLDYCRRMWNCDVRGLEPSAYGVAGSELLSLPIEAATLSDVAGGRTTFDLVFATEVIEHVDDPKTFLAQMLATASPDGVVFLTTPSPDALTQDTPLGELYAALSIGAHKHLLSESYLRRTALELGAGSCEVWRFGMTQAVVLARSATPVPVVRTVDRHRRLLDYYKLRCADARSEPRLRLCDLMHLYIADRQTGGAGDPSLEAQVDELFAAVFGAVISDADSLSAALVDTTTLRGLGEIAPYHLPRYLFWRGHRDDLTEAERTRGWELAALLAARGLSIDPVNMFVNIDVLRLLCVALDGRPQVGPERVLIEELLRAQPETAGLTTNVPSRWSAARWRGVRRLRAATAGVSGVRQTSDP